MSMSAAAVPQAADVSAATGLGLGRTLGSLIAAQESLPPDVRDSVRLFTLDSLGLIVGGSGAPGIQDFARALRAMEPPGGEATTFIDGGRASPLAATMINSAAAHALDFDDTHDEARVHAYCVVLPAALAAAEMRGDVNGADFILAVAVGGELFCRLGLACPNSLKKGWHPTSTFGALAAAAAAAKIFKLDAERTTNALAIAFTQMAGTGQSIIDGALTKRLGAGFASRNGLTGACLAKEGLTGPLRFLEGKAGLFQLYERGDVNPDVITSEFGKRWDLRALSMKPYPCCRCTHSLIQIGIDLHQEGVALEDIREGELLLGKLNHDYVGGPFNPRDTNPVVHAQFNACYAFSQALSKGKVDCETFTKERILSSDAQSAHKFRSGVSPDIDAGAMSPASVRLVLKDGQVKSVFKKTMKGSPEDPLSEAEVLAKFASNLRWGLNIDAGRAARLGERILELPRTKNVTELMRAFARECVRA